MDELAKRAPRTRSASALARSNSSAFCSTGMVKGSMRAGLAHRPSGTGAAGASTTGRCMSRRLARACATARAATRVISGRDRSRLAAKPHAPFTSTRTPKPIDSPLLMFSTRSSRVAMDWLRALETRTSAYDAPMPRAASSAASASSLIEASWWGSGRP